MSILPVTTEATGDVNYQLALAEGWLPIREVARQTGVNAVTLRAWERRYSLVVPQRTSKGHRLYSSAQVQRVHEIMAWLNRGVSVSRVKHLLDSREVENSEPANYQTSSSEDWAALRHKMLEAIIALQESQLDDALNRAMALYPPRTLCAQLLLPLLAQLERRWQGQFGVHLERGFFFTWLRSKLGARIYHNNRQLSGAPLLLVNQSDLPLEPQLWLTAWLASSVDCPVQVFDWPLPPGELALACQHLGACAVLLHASKSLQMTHVPKLIASVDCPIVLVGAATLIHALELAALQTTMAHLHLAETPLQAQQTLQRLGVL